MMLWWAFVVYTILTVASVVLNLRLNGFSRKWENVFVFNICMFVTILLTTFLYHAWFYVLCLCVLACRVYEELPTVVDNVFLDARTITIKRSKNKCVIFNGKTISIQTDKGRKRSQFVQGLWDGAPKWNTTGSNPRLLLMASDQRLLVLLHTGHWDVYDRCEGLERLRHAFRTHVPLSNWRTINVSPCGHFMCGNRRRIYEIRPKKMRYLWTTIDLWRETRWCGHMFVTPY